MFDVLRTRYLKFSKAAKLWYVGNNAKDFEKGNRVKELFEIVLKYYFIKFENITKYYNDSRVHVYFSCLAWVDLASYLKKCF